jgi:hypothetical protein
MGAAIEKSSPAHYTLKKYSQLAAQPQLTAVAVISVLACALGPVGNLLDANGNVAGASKSDAGSDTASTGPCSQ